MRTLVFGSRDCGDQSRVFSALDTLRAKHPQIHIICGACPHMNGGKSVDMLAIEWCISRGVRFTGYPANWSEVGRRAGPKRNAEMIGSGINAAVAFPGGRGTNDMFSKCESSGVTIWDLR